MKERKADFAADTFGTTHGITEVKEEYSGAAQSQIVEDFSAENYSTYGDENYDIVTQSSENVYDENQGTLIF